MVKQPQPIKETTMKTATRPAQLFQVIDSTFGDERFCFHAANLEAAKSKLSGWCSYHGFNMDTRRTLSVVAVDAPKYRDNIHDEWVK